MKASTGVDRIITLRSAWSAGEKEFLKAKYGFYEFACGFPLKYMMKGEWI